MKAILLIAGSIIVLWFLSTLGGNGGNNNESYTTGRYDENTIYEKDPVYEITSDNWECTQDCSGHEAGYEWASENGIADPYDCDGNSESFIEGCRAYANESRIDEEESYDDSSDYPYR